MFAWLGRRSYGTYLYHYPIFKVLEAHTTRGKGALLVLGAGMSIALAALSYQFVELPFLRRKTRLRPSSERALPVGT